MHTVPTTSHTCARSTPAPALSNSLHGAAGSRQPAQNLPDQTNQSRAVEQARWRRDTFVPKSVSSEASHTPQVGGVGAHRETGSTCHLTSRTRAACWSTQCAVARCPSLRLHKTEMAVGVGGRRRSVGGRGCQQASGSCFVEQAPAWAGWEGHEEPPGSSSTQLFLLADPTAAAPQSGPEG